MPITKMFITSDGKQHRNMRAAERHDKQRALEEFLRSNLEPQKHYDENGVTLEGVKFADVVTLVLTSADRLQLFSQAYEDCRNARDFTFEEVEDFVALKVMRYQLREDRSFSAEYIQSTAQKVWNAVAHKEAIDGSYSDLQCDIAHQAKKHFLED